MSAWLPWLVGGGVLLALVARAAYDLGFWGQRSPPPEHVLEVRMKWVEWGISVTAISLGALVMAWFARDLWWSEDLGGALLLGLLSAGAAYLALGAGLHGVAAERTGFVLRIDARGVQHCLLPAIPWTQIRHFELEEHVNQRNRETTYTLRAALESPAVAALVRRQWLRWLVLTIPTVDESSRAVTLGLAWGDKTVHQVVADATRLRRLYQQGGA